MRWKPDIERPRREFTWHRWLAWHPVQIGAERVWLEIVQRRVCYYWGEDGHIPEYEYRNDDD